MTESDGRKVTSETKVDAIRKVGIGLPVGFTERCSAEFPVCPLASSDEIVLDVLLAQILSVAPAFLPGSGKLGITFKANSARRIAADRFTMRCCLVRAAIIRPSVR